MFGKYIHTLELPLRVAIHICNRLRLAISMCNRFYVWRFHVRIAKRKGNSM